MRLRLLIALVASLSASTVVAQPEEPGPGEKPWAEGVSEERQANALELFRTGNDLFERSEYREALEHYREAIDVWEHPAIFYNIAVCLVHLDQPLLAYDNLQKALEHGMAPLGNAVFTQAKTYEKLLANQIGSLAVSCTQKDVVVTVDGVELLRCPGTAKRRLTPGKHQVVGNKEGFIPHTSSVTVLPAEGVEMNLSLFAIQAITLQGQSLDRRWPAWRPWAVLAAGAAIVAVGVPFQLASDSNFKDYDAAIADLCQTQGCTPDDIPQDVADMQSRGRTQNRLAVSAWIAGGTIAAAGLALVLVNQPRVTDKPSTTITPSVGPGGSVSLGLNVPF
jgi:tetratricopeptide (TPR) repeat protein